MTSWRLLKKIPLSFGSARRQRLEWRFQQCRQLGQLVERHRERREQRAEPEHELEQQQRELELEQ